MTAWWNSVKDIPVSWQLAVTLILLEAAICYLIVILTSKK